MRKKKHQKYYRIPAYQILSRKSDDEMAKILGICKRTYKEKLKDIPILLLSKARYWQQYLA